MSPQTHDYRRNVRGWGHDIGFKTSDEGMTLDAYGWGPGLKAGQMIPGRMSVGDFILLSHKDGSDTRYRIDTIKYEHDPKDMWFAQLSFAPREALAPQEGEG